MSAPVSDLVARAKAATMRFDWADLPDDAAIPAVPLLRELAARITELEAALAERDEQINAAREFAKRHPALTLIDLAEFEAFLKLPALIAGGKRDG